MSLESLISRWGLWAVFWGCFFEGETAAVLGGVIAHHGLTGWKVTAIVAFCGAVAGDQMWFLLSRHISGQGWIASRLARLRGKPGAAQIRQWVSDHPDGLTLAFRFVPGTRILGPILLAQAGVSWLRFTALNALSCLVWAVGFTAIGYHFGLAAHVILGRLHGLHLGLLLLFVIAAGLALRLVIRARTRR
ncbi:DedA family protein [Xinfangfangia sp. D13-10-4-6]|uniref:DedA family protein n=1 Tax=Pseudogemmobacter hezensis TaxID=2737662 RepID=UPI00155529B8|nr:VTT domain-containing protein [Pseudogemmobacter hezensis]NPD15666.1 DedA family protein [Pseudogemmobacter hezensis]